MSFLQDYRIVTQNNEVPPTFHLYSGLVALASLIGPKVWLDFGLFRIRPNIYVVLTGGAGIKKTTAMSVAKRFLRQFKSKVPLSAEAQTKEALVKSMAENVKNCVVGKGLVPDEFAPLTKDKSSFVYTPITVCVTEFSQFVGAGSGHMIDFLTTIYDEPIYTNSTKNKGVDSLPMPCLNLLACTVPDWIASQMRTDVITGGFARRAIFVYENERQPRIAFPSISEEMIQAWDRMTTYGEKVCKVSGPMQWGEGAREFFQDWYENRLEYSNNPLMAGWSNSVHIQMIKIAMLISLSESCDNVMQISHMEFALDLLKLVESNIPKVFSSLGRNELFGVGNKLVDLLKIAPNKALPIAEVKRELFREVNPMEFKNVVQQLTDTKTIEQCIQKDPITKQNKPYYRLL